MRNVREDKRIDSPAAAPAEPLTGSLPQLPEITSFAVMLQQLRSNGQFDKKAARSLALQCLDKPADAQSSTLSAKERRHLSRLTQAFTDGLATVAGYENSSASLRAVGRQFEVALNLMDRCPGLALDTAAIVISSSVGEGIAPHKVGECLNRVMKAQDRELAPLTPEEKRSVILDTIELAKLRKSLRPEVGDQITYENLAKLYHEIGDTNGVQMALEAIDSVPLASGELTRSGHVKKTAMVARLKTLIGIVKDSHGMTFNPHEVLSAELRQAEGKNVRRENMEPTREELFIEHAEDSTYDDRGHDPFDGDAFGRLSFRGTHF